MILSITFMIFCYNFFMVKNFGEKLKELRKEKGLTQKELAQFLDSAQSAIVYWEKNQQEPNISTLKKIAIFFDVTTDYLLGLEDETGAKIYNNYGIHNGDVKF